MFELEGKYLSDRVENLGSWVFFSVLFDNYVIFIILHKKNTIWGIF
jgi:hypothetical protein